MSNSEKVIFPSNYDPIDGAVTRFLFPAILALYTAAVFFTFKYFNVDRTMLIILFVLLLLLIVFYIFFKTVVYKIEIDKNEQTIQLHMAAGPKICIFKFQDIHQIDHGLWTTVHFKKIKAKLSDYAFNDFISWAEEHLTNQSRRTK